MSSLNLVYVSPRVNVYGQTEFDIKTLEGNYLCRCGIGNRNQAYKIAESIEAKMLYEREHGVGSLDFF